MEENILNSAVKELEEISKELGELKSLKSEIATNLSEVKSAINECTELLNAFKDISSNINDSTEILKIYSDRIEAVNKDFSKQLDEAKQIENRIMLEKMDLLISKAEKLSNTSLNEERKETSGTPKADRSKQKDTKTKENPEEKTD